MRDSVVDWSPTFRLFITTTLRVTTCRKHLSGKTTPPLLTYVCTLNS
jgi:hypothetical protein